jgi:hypothetical protein
MGGTLRCRPILFHRATSQSCRILIFLEASNREGHIVLNTDTSLTPVAMLEEARVMFGLADARAAFDKLCELSGASHLAADRWNDFKSRPTHLPQIVRESFLLNVRGLSMV